MIDLSMSNKYRYDPEQKKTYYTKNRDKILAKLAKKRELEDKTKKKKKRTYKKADDATLEKQAWPRIIANCPKFREYIRQLIKEYEEQHNTDLDQPEL